MSPLDRLPLRGKLLLVILSASLPIVLLLGFGVLYIEGERTREGLRRELAALATVVGHRALGAMAFHDENSGRESLGILATLPYVELGCLYHEGGRLFASYAAPMRAAVPPPECPATTDPGIPRDGESGESVTVQRPVRNGDAVVGAVLIRSSLSPVAERLRERLVDHAILAAVALLFAVALAYALRQLVSRPIERELQERVLERTAELEAANRELESFTYTVSHDLRAPVRAILGYGAILREDHASRLDDEGHRLLDRVSASAERMGLLIDDLLAFSHSSRAEPAMAVVDMGTLARQVIAELPAPRGDAPQIVVGELPPARGDASLLRQVWQNLIGNAHKFSRDAKPPRIEIGARDRGESVEYFVRDNGVGFDMQYARKLFQAFQRLHGVDEFEGSGVGLATVDRIVRRHGGTVRAKGEPGRGATLSFILPRSPPSG